MDQKISKKAEAIILNITIPNEGWVKDESDETGWSYYLDIDNALFDKDMSPQLSVKMQSLKTAIEAGICPAVMIYDGKLRIYSAAVPADSMSASLLLVTAENIDFTPEDDTASQDDIDGVIIDQYPDD